MTRYDECWMAQYRGDNGEWQNFSDSAMNADELDHTMYKQCQDYDQEYGTDVRCARVESNRYGQITSVRGLTDDEYAMLRKWSREDV